MEQGVRKNFVINLGLILLLKMTDFDERKAE